MYINRSGLFLVHYLKMNWQPIATAPFERDLELAVFDAAGELQALLFPCRRRALGGWLNPKTIQRIDLQPTHWRECREQR
jgi:hypothetical protein